MTQPNFVLYITDDQTFESIRRMPSVFNRIANNGVFFSNAFTNTSICMVARATMLTGQYSHNHNIIENEVPYETLDETTLLPKVLQDNGYWTALAGKYLNDWNPTIDPAPIGWDEFYGTDQAYFEYYVNHNGSVTQKTSANADYHTTFVTETTKTLITAAIEPFFIVSALYAPHNGGPVGPIANADYINSVSTSKTFPKGPDWNLADVTDKPYYIHDAPLIDAPSEAFLHSRWRAATETNFSINKSIDEICDALVSAGKEDNTIFIFTSDNGFFHGEQRVQGSKIWPYECSIHIPMVISGPASLVAQNKTCDHIVSHVDLTSTIYELAEVVPPLTQDGISLVSYLADPQIPSQREYLLIEWLGDFQDRVAYRCVRSKKWKYTEYIDDAIELYDLIHDPFELTNLAYDANYSAKVTELSALIAQGTDCSGNQCVL